MVRFPFLSYLGPGLLYAGAAVGVSHLVQSTRAGAMFGYELIFLVLFANLIKYPFFYVGTKYTISTGKSLLDGYQNLGSIYVWIFFFISTGTMCIIVATVTLVTSGLLANLFQIQMEPALLCAFILLFCLFLLGLGKYSALDFLMKWVVVLLTLATLVALGLSFYADIPKLSTPGKSFQWKDVSDIAFLIALMGWMPIPIEAAVWQSEWTLAKRNDRGELPPLKYALLDFNIGYVGTTLLAICFLLLGSNMMYNTGKEFSSSAASFAAELVELYATAIGSWAYPIILIAAFFTMFSTTLTCFDAYPRVVSDASKRLFSLFASWKEAGLYWFWILVVGIGSIALLFFFRTSMKSLVDFATTVSFLNAPVLALIHHFILFGREIPKESRPGPGMYFLSLFGIFFLTGFSFYYLQRTYF